MRIKTAFICVLALVGLITVYWQANSIRLELGSATEFTGYTALTVMLLMALFNVRKKLAAIPILQARVWLVMHVVFGLGLVLLFWLHTRSVWPSGLYEQIIATLFYLVSITGVVGYVLSRTIPARLRHTGNEIIYERIADEIYQLREAAKTDVSTALEASGNETLSREYKESLAWFFAQPRFVFSHISGSARPTAWVETKATSLRPFLSDAEQTSFDALLQRMHYKNQVDAHYANQKLLKLWLFLHLPLTVALLVFVAWHVLLVHLYVI